MILYFSATGNCKYVAQKIADSIGDTAYSIENFKTQLALNKEEFLSFITPTYFWELPIIVREYLKKLSIRIESGTYVFVIATYGTTPGTVGEDAAKLLKEKGLPVSAKYSIQMPDTWTPIFDLSDANNVQRQLDKADEELQFVISHIRSRKQGNFMRRAVPYPVRYISNIIYNGMRKTNHFTVENSCIGCGLCEKRCPAGAIQLENGKPIWKKERCIMCLRCLHHCPKFAIQYGSNTIKHGQYHHPKVKV